VHYCVAAAHAYFVVSGTTSNCNKCGLWILVIIQDDITDLMLRNECIATSLMISLT